MQYKFSLKIPVTGTLLLLFILTLSQWPASVLAAPSQIKNIALSEGQEVSIEHYPASGKHLLLWFASGFGFNKNHQHMAKLLAQDGYETWMVDLADNLFLTRGSTALKEVPGKYVADIIASTHRISGKKILIVSSSYGAIPALRGVHHWQNSKPNSPYILGTVLFSPNLYTTVPALGKDPDYLPIASASNVPIYIFQSERNGNRWQLPRVVQKLRAGGSRVYTEILREVVAIFYGDEFTPQQQRTFDRIPSRFSTIIRLLEAEPISLTNHNRLDEGKKSTKGLDIGLKRFQGHPVPMKIELKDIQGKHYKIDSFRGKVTVVNFWATWCPPCVEEIPSLNRLKQKLSDIPFELISIDYAENHQSVATFLKKIKVEFPVLLDTDGKVANRWKVISFPSTFIIGPDGKIQYGVNAALEWDKPEVEQAIRNLLKTKP